MKKIFLLVFMLPFVGYGQQRTLDLSSEVKTVDHGRDTIKHNYVWKECSSCDSININWQFSHMPAGHITHKIFGDTLQKDAYSRANGAYIVIFTCKKGKFVSQEFNATHNFYKEWIAEIEKYPKKTVNGIITYSNDNLFYVIKDLGDGVISIMVTGNGLPIK